MVILVTGGCGFIGGAFVRYVLKNTDAKVINVDLLTYAGTSPTEYPEYKVRHSFYQLDIGSNEIGDLLEAHRPDYIINFAAEIDIFALSIISSNVCSYIGVQQSSAK